MQVLNTDFHQVWTQRAILLKTWDKWKPLERNASQQKTLDISKPGDQIELHAESNPFLSHVTYFINQI